MEAKLEEFLQTFGKAFSAGKQQSSAEMEMKRNEEQLDPTQGSSSDSSAILCTDATTSMPFQQPPFFGNSPNFDPASDSFWQEVFPLLGRNLTSGSTADSAVEPRPSSAVGSSPPPPSPSPLMLEDPTPLKTARTTQPSNHPQSAASRILKIVKGEFSDNDDEDDVREMSAMLSDEVRRTFLELETFVKAFKEKRVELGLSQSDVGAALSKRYARSFTPLTVSRFERFFFSMAAMCEMRPLLEGWLTELKNALEAGAKISDLIGRKTLRGSYLKVGQDSQSRKVFILAQRNFLNASFESNPHPDKNQLTEMAGKLGVEIETVRLWFKNKRAKSKKSKVSTPSTPSKHRQMSPSEQSQEVGE